MVLGLLLGPPAIQRYREIYRTLFAQEMSDWPDGIREVLIERHVSLEWLWADLQESGTLISYMTRFATRDRCPMCR